MGSLLHIAMNNNRMKSLHLTAKTLILSFINDIGFPSLLSFMFFCLGFMGILNHAMWRDELNPWLIARDSKSLVELFQNIKYEGHPGLWYICLYLLNQLTQNPIAMQITHLILATGFIYIFLKFSPFRRWQKALFVFGYLPFYEYLLISRNYIIGILLIAAFCALYNTRKKNYVILSVLLFLIANANAYCLFISLALGLALIVEYSLRKQLDESLTASRTNIILSLTIYALGIAVSLAQLIPPADSTLQGGLSGWTLHFDLRHLAKALIRIWNSYIVILVPGDSNIEVFLFAVLALGLFFFASTVLIRKPIAFLIYTVGTLEIIFFTYVKFLGSARHYGHLYIVLIASFWLASYYPKSNLLLQPFTRRARMIQPISTVWFKFTEKYKIIFMMVIFSAQLAAGVVAFSRDLVVPYSAARATATYIQSQHLENKFMVGSRDATISPLCGYLNRKIYYPERQELGSFVLFNSQRQDVDAATVLAQVSQRLQQKPEPILLILNNELNTARADLKISPLSKFTKSFIFNEKYYLYEVSPAVKS
ncbi:hypothetical protein Mic7113_2235 [Allocoleopsis franciscana PCC 7113]|uniref:Glycosyltransferase RgtA/B/C/D-like domain-containing protein n=2 Tax=Allocoleopsis TaxID=2886347 RepID=K9WE57_9CYAN|nr:hypothetical protein Mic7113_2235 [Allocoleopsis franciscana PCC 7113]